MDENSKQWCGGKPGKYLAQNVCVWRVGLYAWYGSPAFNPGSSGATVCIDIVDRCLESEQLCVPRQDLRVKKQEQLEPKNQSMDPDQSIIPD